MIIGLSIFLQADNIHSLFSNYRYGNFDSDV